MSYKADLSDLGRLVAEGERGTVTTRLVEFFASRIEAGELEPGDQLPTTRALAEAAGVNHLTAARAYRRLAEDGLVTASVGRGTFVSAIAAAADAQGDDWQTYVLPEAPRSYAGEVLEDSFRMAGQPGLLSLAVGFPAAELHPVAELARHAADVFAQEGADAVSYGPTDGLLALREQLAARGRKSGFASSPDEIILTTGARQGIDVTTRALLRPGDVVAVESPTFAGMLESLQTTGARVIGIPVDEDGLDVAELERLVARHEVKLCALQPACQNPTGQTLSAPRRKRLVELARERSFFILEDAVYAPLDFEGDTQPRLRADAPSHVIYVDSLSKTIGGGMRVGWVAARGPVLSRIAALKTAGDTHSSMLDQHIAARYLASGHHDESITSSLPFYRERCEALMEALDRHMAGEYRAMVPRGGHHVWVTLESSVPERALVAEAVRHGVAFTPGGATLAEPVGPTSFRLSFGRLAPEQLDEGVRRLARALRSVRRYDRAASSAPVS
jgi:DNA-binding transcriptional MocR family regulator